MDNKFDLTIVLPTLGRLKEVEAMLGSIYKFDVDPMLKIEIIVVDQNFSDLLDELVVRYSQQKYPILHHKVSFRGLSKAKNYGAKHARGKYICFVDDDAEFLEGTINMAIKLLETNKYDIVSGRCIDREGNNSVINFENKSSELSLNCFENRFVESTMFFRKEICDRYSYDDNMGIGAFYGAEEGYDLVYRMLCDNVRIHFEPSICFYHPQTVTSYVGDSTVRRAFTYRTGYGHLCKKHGFRKKYWSRLIKVCLYIPYLLCFKPKNARYYFAELLGLLVGKYL